jgi:hypothetical protein
MHNISSVAKLLLCAIALASVVVAQSKDAQNNLGTKSKAQASAPSAFADLSGTYSFLRDGELLELNLQDGRVIGDVQRFGSSDADRGVMLTHFFEKASLDGNRLEFTTRTVHGVYFGFKGRIERGEGKIRTEEDYYRIVGTLTEYTGDGRKKISARKREVIFKSFPDDLGETSGDSK